METHLHMDDDDGWSICRRVRGEYCGQCSYWDDQARKTSNQQEAFGDQFEYDERARRLSLGMPTHHDLWCIAPDYRRWNRRCPASSPPPPRMCYLCREIADPGNKHECCTACFKRRLECLAGCNHFCLVCRFDILKRKVYALCSECEYSFHKLKWNPLQYVSCVSLDARSYQDVVTS